VVALRNCAGVAAPACAGSPVTAGAEFLVQPVGVAAALFHRWRRWGKVRVQDTDPAAGASAVARRVGGVGVAAHCLAVQVQARLISVTVSPR